MGLVAGIDSSTQSTKVVLRRVESGEIVASAQAAHSPTAPPTSEQQPEEWADALAAALGELSDDDLSEVTAVSVAGQQHGLVVLDADGRSLRPAKLWNDTTSDAEAAELVGDEPSFWANACGSVPLPAFTITKLAWLVAREPEVAKQVAKVMLPHDYLTWRLTGAHVTDRGDASGTGWFDPSTNSYRSDLLERAVDDPASWIERLPTVVRSGQAAGEITGAASETFGLPAGIPVGTGTGDNMAAALGLGLRPGDAAISLGTSGTVYATSPTATHDPTGAIAGFADATEHFLPLICTMNATKVTNAIAEWLGVSLDELSALALGAAGSQAGSRPVLLPYLDGERNPNLPAASGEWTGLRAHTTRGELALSAYDSVLCSLLEGFDALAGADIALDGSIFLIGGGSHAPAYRQRAADLSGRAVTIPDDQELVATGAAAQAAALVSGNHVADVAAAWSGTAQTIVEPANDDADEVRSLHRDARNRAVSAAD